MNRLISLLTFCIFWSVATTNAQSFMVTEDSIYASSVSPVNCHDSIINISSNTINLTWRRIANNIPGSWSSAICDPNQCHSPMTSTETFLLSPGEGDLFDVDFLAPDSGFGTVIVEIFETMDSANTVQTVVFQANALPVIIGVFPEDPISEINVYPNPPISHLYIDLKQTTGICTLGLYDALGRLFLSEQAESPSIHPLNHSHPKVFHDWRKMFCKAY